MNVRIKYISITSVLVLACFMFFGCAENGQQTATQEDEQIEELKRQNEEQQRQLDELKNQQQEEASVPDQNNSVIAASQPESSNISNAIACDKIFYFENEYRIKNRDGNFTTFTRCKNSVVKCNKEKSWIRDHYKNDDTFSKKDIDFLINQIEKDYTDYLVAKKSC